MDTENCNDIVMHREPLKYTVSLVYLFFYPISPLFIKVSMTAESQKTCTSTIVIYSLLVEATLGNCCHLPENEAGLYKNEPKKCPIYPQYRIIQTFSLLYSSHLLYMNNKPLVGSDSGKKFPIYNHGHNKLRKIWSPFPRHQC